MPDHDDSTSERCDTCGAYLSLCRCDNRRIIRGGSALDDAIRFGGLRRHLL